MKESEKSSLVLTGIVVAFALLTVAFLFNLWGHPASLPVIPLVDLDFIKTNTVRTSYSELVATKQDLSDFDCYG